MSSTYHTTHAFEENLTQTKQNAPLAQLDQAIADTYLSNEGIVTLVSDKLAVPTLSLSKADRGNRNIIVAAQTGTSDNLNEVTGITVGDLVALRADAGDSILVLHNSGSATIKILTKDETNFYLSETTPVLFLYVETNKLVQMTSLPKTAFTFYSGTYTPAAIISETSTTFVAIDSTNIKESIFLAGTETVVMRIHLPAISLSTGGSTVGTLRLVADNGTPTASDDALEVSYEIVATESVWMTAIWTGLATGTWAFQQEASVRCS